MRMETMKPQTKKEKKFLPITNKVTTFTILFRVFVEIKMIFQLIENQYRDHAILQGVLQAHRLE